MVNISNKTWYPQQSFFPYWEFLSSAKTWEETKNLILLIFQICLLQPTGYNQELANFCEGQQPSTIGSGRPQCKTNNQSVLMITTINKIFKIYLRALSLVS